MSQEGTLRAPTETYREAVERAAGWLGRQLNPDGSMNPVEKGALTYYKVPRGFQVVGRLREAHAMLDWAGRTILTPDGDFAAERQAFHHYHYTYSSAWFVWVAQLLGRFDVSYRGMEYLRRFRNPHTGGYCSEATYAADNHNEQDLLSISFNAFVGLHLGLVHEARAAAALIRRILDQQPDPETRVWLRADAEGGLVARVDPGCDEPRYYVLEIEAPEQYY